MVVVFIFSELSDPLDADDAIGRCIMKMWIKYREPLLEWVNRAYQSCIHLVQYSTAVSIWMCKSFTEISLNHIECGYKVIVTGGSINNDMCSDHSAWQLSPSEVCTKYGQLTQPSQWLKVLPEIMLVYNLSNKWLKAEGKQDRKILFK